MPTVRCENGHNYDDRKHLRCPYCPVPGLRNATVPRTEAASVSRPSMPQTEPASAGPASSPVRSSGSPERGAPGVTVGAVQKRIGIEPVVGWLVCIKGANKGRDYRLHSDLNKLGRGPNMDVCIEGDETISRENHCQIAYSPRSGTFSIVPGIGRNLIYRNGEDVLTATPLQAYDCLDFGESSFLFIPFCTDRFAWEAQAPRAQQPAEPEAVKPARNFEPRVD